MSREQERWRDVWAFQSGEIEALAADAERALRAGLRPHYSRIASWLRPDLKGRVLELGCGPGRYVALLASLGHDVVGVDPFPDPSWDIIRKYRSTDLRSGVFAENLPFEDASFDHVACLGAMLYFKDIKRSLSEMHRVTRPGGRAVFRTVSDHHLYTLATGKRLDTSASNYFTPKTMKTALEASGFEVNRQFSYGFFPPFKSATWWWLVNGQIPIAAQEAISAFTFPAWRVNLVAFATRK